MTEKEKGHGREPDESSSKKKKMKKHAGHTRNAPPRIKKGGTRRKLNGQQQGKE